MIVNKVSVPLIEDVTNLPSFKRRGDTLWILGSESITNRPPFNKDFYCYVDKNGLIDPWGTTVIDDTRPIINFKVEDKENINIGAIINFDGKLFEVIGENKAICMETVKIDNLFSIEYIRADVSGPNEYEKEVKLNNQTLEEYLNSTSKAATKVDCPVYDSEEHVNIENKLMEELIKYYYPRQKEIMQGLYGSKEVEGGTYDISSEKLKHDIKNPNLFERNLYEVIEDNYNYDADIKFLAFGLLKQAKVLGFNDTLETLGDDFQPLNEEIEKLKPLYYYFVKYQEYNNIYQNYLDTINNKNKAL